MKDIWKYIISILVGIVIGILVNVPSCSKSPEPEIVYIEKHDTVTVEKERIVEKTKIKYINRIDTFYVKESGDTVPVQDLPIEHKIYEDTIKTDSTSTEIQVNFHGFNAGIDSIWLKHNYFEKETTIVKEPKKVGLVWYIGVGAGFGGHIDIPAKQIGWGPLFGIHVGVGIGGKIR